MKKETMGTEEIYLAPETVTESEPPAPRADSAPADPADISVESAQTRKPAARVSEILAARAENRKVFRMSDGTEQAVFYPESIHVRNDDADGWDDVDTTLAAEADGRHFVSGKVGFTARFSREETDDELFSIEHGACRVTAFAKRPAAAKNRGVQPTLRRRARATDALTFEGVHEGADYEYSVTGGGVKENIIIKEKGVIYRYPFLLRCENVTARPDEQGRRVAFLSTETGDEVFFIPAPFMSDAAGATSTAVSYEMKPVADGTVQLTVIADSTWINSDERILPVTIDPQIKLSDSAAMTTYQCIDGDVLQPLMMGTKVGVVSDNSQNPCYTAHRMYMTFKMPALPRNPRIKKVELKLVQSGFSVVDTTKLPNLGLYAVNDTLSVGAYPPLVQHHPHRLRKIGSH